VTPAGTGASSWAPALALGPSAPNPFGEATWIPFTLERAGAVTLRVHDAAGRLVRTLMAAERGRGVHRAGWDGRDAAGRRVPAGVYYLRLTGPGATASRPVVHTP
jgi:hypothetical protein